MKIFNIDKMDVEEVDIDKENYIEINWDDLLYIYGDFLTENFINKYYENFSDKNKIIKNIRYLSTDFIEKHYNDFDKKTLFREQILDRSFFERHSNDYSYDIVKEWNILTKEEIKYYYGSI